jgi:hypothetical protein
MKMPPRNEHDGASYTAYRPAQIAKPYSFALRQRADLYSDLLRSAIPDPILPERAGHSYGRYAQAVVEWLSLRITQTHGVR